MGRAPSKKRRAKRASGRRAPKGAKKVATKSIKKSAAKRAAGPLRRRASRGTRAKAEIARLSRELSEALARQTATAEVLQVISSSPGDLKPVFESMLAKAMRLCEAQCGFIYQVEQGAMRAVAEIGVPPAFAEYRRNNLHTGGAATPADVVRATKKPAHVHDARDSEPYRAGNPNAVAGVDLGGARTVLYIPMIKNDDFVGVINVYRQEVRPFTEEQIALLENFADQAVIAIENARLLNETQEALERQTATGDILRVIASSPNDVQPVFQAVADQSNRLLNGIATAVYSLVDDVAHLMSFTPVGAAADAALKASFPIPLADVAWGASIRTGEIFRIIDTEDESAPRRARDLGRARGWRSAVFVPLLSEGTPIGAISVTRSEPGSFADHHVQLLRTFADQAVIAIQNVELFEEVQARTRDLQESLQQQTATADVLKVISRSAFDLQTVLDTLVESAYKLCGAGLGLLHLRGEEAFECKATAGIGVEAANELFKGRPIRAGRGTAAERVILTGEVQAVTDFFADPDFDPVVRERIRNDSSASEISQLRSTLAVPMTRENEVVGVLVIARTQTGPFPQRQIELLQTFADQAVIAIENLRLFNETREALARQTATADVLKVIASSPSNLQPVFDAIATRSKELIGGHSTIVVRYVDGMIELVAFTPVSPEADAALRGAFPRPISSVAHFDRIVRGELVETVETQADSEPERSRTLARARDYRSRLMVPLRSDSGVIGTISVTRKEPGAFADKDKELLQTFADQAVIAIQNVELFEQVQAKTRELEQSLDDLRTAQDRLVQTEKLASLGQLTAGIAHEIKNPLNFVNNFAALSVELTDELNDALKAEKLQHEVNELTQLLKSNLEKVVQHGKRADSIVKNMLLHSREGSGEQRAADINSLVEESLNLAYHGARAEKSGFNITLQREFDAGAGTAELFPQEITRALLNLISNGFYAAIRRKAENRDGVFEPTLLARTKDLGHAVEIRIRDNGTGISPEVKEKMFNPFFTTKPAGEGTGLGLSMTHDIIVKQHGGTIDVASEPGNFTEFVVVLPRANGSQTRNRGQA